MQEPEFSQYDIDTLKDDVMMVYRFADDLLQDPYKRLLDSLEKINDSMNEETEI